MKKVLIWIIIAIYLVSGLYGVGEQIISIGTSSGWRTMETRQDLIEIPQLRSYPVLGLSSSYTAITESVDLYLSFDEGNTGWLRDHIGNYDIRVGSTLGLVGENLARRGMGAASFSGSSGAEGPLVLQPRNTSLFTPGNTIWDFSIDFWLNPASLENGEQIMSWTSSYPRGARDYTVQRIRCEVSRNRLEWTFSNFFTDPQKRILLDPGAPGNPPSTIVLTGSPILPRTWSHHLIRFNADLGLLEYFVDGRQEALIYSTPSGREGGEIAIPIIGEECSLILGGRFTGFMDEFRISGRYIDDLDLRKFPVQGGRTESRPLDLGSSQSRLLKIEASGGRAHGAGESRNDLIGERGFRFSDHSELRFYVRFSNNQYYWSESPWIPVEIGRDLGGDFMGRYVQIAVDFFPSMDGEITPYLEELHLIYRRAEPLPPPSQFSVFARDGAVEIIWRPVMDINLGGYFVYFGTSSEEYFGDPGALSSPIDAGNQTSIRIEGLQNGTLYYFSIASYDNVLREPGDFSREAAARPQRDFSR